MKQMEFYAAGSGRHFPGGVNYLISDDYTVYVECPVPDGAKEDYGYLRLKKAIPENVAKDLTFPYDEWEDRLSEDADKATEVYVEIEVEDDN